VRFGYAVSTVNAGSSHEDCCQRAWYSNYGVTVKKVSTYSEARQKLSKLLHLARSEEVIIKKRGGEIFAIVYKQPPNSIFAIHGVKTKVKTRDILEAVDASRSSH
jgi:prevent-host-death family protein